MKNLALIILAGLFSTACGAIGATSDLKPKPGDTVTFKVSREGFGEGVIEAVEGAQYKIKYGDSVVSKEESDVYALPKSGSKSAVKTGEMVVAKIESGGKYWAGAEVLSAAGEVIEVKDLQRGTTANLSPDKIIAVRPAAAAEFQKIKTEADFKKKAHAARPRAAAGYKPKTGERVVAEWSGNSWWVGEIQSVAGSKAKIKWNTSFPVSELGFEKIMPFPTAANSAALPVVNNYVLVKPETDSGQWFYAQVTAADNGTAEVKFPDGKTRSIKSDGYIALN